MPSQMEGSHPKTDVTLSMIVEGDSKTFELAETREATQSARIHGSRGCGVLATRQGPFASTRPAS